MKKLLLLVCGGVFMSATVNAATYSITKMEIYPRGAKVTFAVEAAPNVTIEIPGAFDQESIQPTTKSAQKINYFQTKAMENNEPPPSLVALSNNISKLREKVAFVDAKIQSHSRTIEIINNLSNSDEKSDLSSQVPALLESHLKSSTELAALRIESEKLNKELRILTNEYNESLPANYERYTIVSLGSNEKGLIEIEATTPYANWRSAYRMDLNSTTNEIEAKLMAEITQRTGVNYNGSVELYTQQPPSRDLYIPQLNPLVVDFKKNMENRYESAKMMNQIAAAPAMKQIEEELAYDEPIVQESLINAVIKGKGKLDGDGAPVSINLGTKKHKTDLTMVLARDYGQEATLVANIKVTEPTLPGNAELSVDGQSSGRTYVKSTGRGETLTIPMGKMPLVKVNKKSNVVKTGSGWLAGSVQDGYTLEVVNGSKIDANIELIDRIPFSSNDKIVVENVTITPPPTENKNGVLKWVMTVKAGERKTFDVKYKIKHPSNEEINYR